MAMTTPCQDLSPLHAGLYGLVCVALAAASATAGADRVDAAAYDRDLCALAQRMLVNADGEGEPPFKLSVLSGVGNGFHTIQMDVDRVTRTVTVAETTGFARSEGQEIPTYVACKLVDRDRVNDVLGLQLDGPERSCRDVNERTYALALANLSPEERQHYDTSGRGLRFDNDVPLATGAEWLPAAPEKFIRELPAASGGRSRVEVRAPAVIVPWVRADRQFFQGTHHCKLITLASMQHWMRGAALAPDGQLLPPSKAACEAPSAMVGRAGSCVFYFAPAGGRFCQDYSGPGWTLESARAECGRRHASAEALQAAGNRYAGGGGRFSEQGCAERPQAEPGGGTCVFHCGQDDETLWHILDPAAAGTGASAMMTRACDLFLP